MTNLHRVVISAFLWALLLPLPSLASEAYRFEQMFPVYEQPWYFFHPSDVCSDNAGFIYVVNTENDAVFKFTSEGKLVTLFGRFGSGDGEFILPSGIASDLNGYLYVADSGNHRIQKFDSNGCFIAKWGSKGTNKGEFDNPRSIAVDDFGFVYVMDVQNHRVQKFTSDGQFVILWGGSGDADGKFKFPLSLAVSRSGVVYAADTGNKRIQMFTSEGVFIGKWSAGQDGSTVSHPDGIEVDKDNFVYVSDNFDPCIRKFSSDGRWINTWCGELNDPDGIAADNKGFIYVADKNNNRIQKYTQDGIFISVWGSSSADGEFNFPQGIAVDSDGRIFAADSLNHRIQRFNLSGQFETKWGRKGTGDGEFKSPSGIAIDANRIIYIADTDNHRIQTFDSEGRYLSQWGVRGKGKGQFILPSGLAVAKDGGILVADTGNHRIQTFTSEGKFVNSWGQHGSNNGEFNTPHAVAVDSDGFVYVTDKLNHRVQKFSSQGSYVIEWGGKGSEYGKFNMPEGIQISKDGFVYVTDSGNHRIQKFSSDGKFIVSWGEGGHYPGQMKYPASLAISPTDDSLYAADKLNNRIQKFSKISYESNTKAIIAAGGGSYPGNRLWNATQLCAHFAYRTLYYRGFTKQNIRYLSSDTSVDLDANGIADDVDDSPSQESIRYAITEWASDATDVILYLVDHGGRHVFRVNESETLSANSLGEWVDSLQKTISGKVIIIYDACDSGSFIEALSGSGDSDRIVITSASENEDAYFLSNGSLSFSKLFWTGIFNGQSIQNAFDIAGKSIAYITKSQHPIFKIFGSVSPHTGYIGVGHELNSEAPIIEDISISVRENHSVWVTAENVRSVNGVERVWAIMVPSVDKYASPYLPILEFPSVELLPTTGNRYEAIFDRFMSGSGENRILVYASDRKGNISFPKFRTITNHLHLRQKAIIVAGDSTDAEIKNYAVKTAAFVQSVLKQQGFKTGEPDDDIYFLSPVAIPGVDGSSTYSNLKYAITAWGIDSAHDVIVFLTGEGKNGNFRINSTEVLSAKELDTWLDIVQESVLGTALVVIDTPMSDSFIKELNPPANKARIVITDWSDTMGFRNTTGSNLSFSHFFWEGILYGKDVRTAFMNAGQSVQLVSGFRMPLMDDNGNGIGNEKSDGLIAKTFTVGTGIQRSSDAPKILPVQRDVILEGNPTAVLRADSAMTTRTICSVRAVITPPGSRMRVTGSAFADMHPTADGKYEGRYSGFVRFGDYQILVYADDDQGDTFLLYNSLIYQSSGPDSFEDDDEISDAVPIIINDIQSQRHNFDSPGDADWVKFYGVSGQAYRIHVDNLEEHCDPVIELYPENILSTPIQTANTIGNPQSPEMIEWQCDRDGVYYVKIRHHQPDAFGKQSGYDLAVYSPIGPLWGFAAGTVADASGNPVAGARIKTGRGISGISFPNGAYLVVLEPGKTNISAEASGYDVSSDVNIFIGDGGTTVQDFILFKEIIPPDSDSDSIPPDSDSDKNNSEKHDSVTDDSGSTDDNETPETSDLCPDDLQKTEPGACGCGVSDNDSDRDGTPDCHDLCPNDPDKTEPGNCGCGTPETEGEIKPIPEKPLLNSPNNGQQYVSLTPVLQVKNLTETNPHTGHFQTQWQISRQLDFSELVLDVTSSKHLYSLAVPDLCLNRNTMYYWRTRFFHTDQAASEWSDNFSFTTLDTAEVYPEGISIFDQDDKKCISMLIEDILICIQPVKNVTAIETVRFIDSSAISDTKNRPDQIPFGMIGLKCHVNNIDEPSEVNVHFSKPLPTNGRWYRYDAINGWSDYSDRADFSNDMRSASITFTDGSFGDADACKNRTIVHTSGFGFSSVSVPSVENCCSGKEIEHGSGNCFINSLAFTDS